MREILFYRTVTNRCPIEDFLDSLSDREVKKILWVLKLIKELKRVPKQYFKKVVNSDDIWEVRSQVGKNTYRLLGLMHNSNLVILTNGFAKKSQKIPKTEIGLAEKRKKEYLIRK